MATEIDLPWTYVGGPAGLIERLLADERIEALPASPGDPLTRAEEWVATWVDGATATLLAGGEAVISTCRGTVRARLHRPTWLHPGTLRTRSMGDNGVSTSGEIRLSHRTGGVLRDEISFYLAHEVIGLVGG